MTTLQALLSDTVQQFLKDTRTPQSVLANDLGITQATLSRKLSGIRAWNLKDVDQLMRIGVPIGLEAYGAPAWESDTYTVAED